MLPLHRVPAGWPERPPHGSSRPVRAAASPPLCPVCFHPRLGAHAGPGLLFPDSAFPHPAHELCRLRISSGCRNETLQTRLKQQRCVFSWSWRPEVKVKKSAGLVSFLSLLCRRPAVFSLCPHVLSLPCVSGSPSPLLLRTQLYWVRAHPRGFISPL